MTFVEFMTEARKTFRDGLNGYLSSAGLRPLTVLDSGVKLHDRPRSVAVYPTSSSGSTYSQDGDAASVRINVELYLNESATEEGYLEAERYYSAIIGFIESGQFGDWHAISDSVLCRMEEGWPANGAIFLVESRIETQSDYGWA